MNEVKSVYVNCVYYVQYLEVEAQTGSGLDDQYMNM
jgi:hypothetical protein